MITITKHDKFTEYRVTFPCGHYKMVADWRDTPNEEEAVAYLKQFSCEL